VETKCDDFVRHFYSFVDASSKANVKSEAWVLLHEFD
jgi:hypothetical protein